MENSSNPFFETGKIIDGKWAIIEMIGKGAMGEVYRAHQLNLKRDVAIKVISAEMLKDFEDNDVEIETAFGRFKREVQTMAQVRHANILQIFDYGTIQASKQDRQRHLEYIVMEYIPGDTLRYTMSDEGTEGEPEMTRDWVTRYFLPVLDGVEVMHRNRIVHRDLKPENVLMDDDKPKIADFGLARSDRMKGLSNSFEIKGTVAYMAPEQYSDFRKAESQVDIYALGKILFEAISGKMEGRIIPFKSARLEAPQTPFFQKIDDIIQTATAEQKEIRFQTVAEFRKAVTESLDILKAEEQQPAATLRTNAKASRHARWLWAGIILAVVSVGAMALWHLAGEPGKPPMQTALSAQQAQDVSSGTKPEIQAPVKPAMPPDTIIGKDGIPMLLVGKELPGVAGTKSQPGDRNQPGFYVDKTLVTNHHFAEFLNEVRENITVEAGVVKSSGDIWFYLGDGKEPFEQIVFKHNKFHLKDPTQGGNPVVRVTYYGARAYARHFGKQLLTESQWLAAAKTYPDDIAPAPGKHAEPEASLGQHTHIMMPGADGSSAPDRFAGNTEGSQETAQSGKMERVSSEWITASHPDSPGALSEPSSRIIARTALIGQSKVELRYPWEGFKEVGFRTATKI